MSKPAKTVFPKFFVARPRVSLTELDLFGTRPGIGLPKPTGDVVFEITATGASEQDAIQNLRDIKQKEQTEAQAKLEANRQAQHEADRLKQEAEPKSCGPVLPPGELLSLRRSPNLDSIIANAPAGEALVSSSWISYGARYFCDRLIGDDNILLFGPGSKAMAYRDLRGSLVCFNAVDLNPRSVGAEPKRKWLVTRWGMHPCDSARRISYLHSLGECALTAIVYDAARVELQAYWNVERLSQKRLESFVRSYVVDTGGEARTALGGFMAALPGAPVETKANDLRPILSRIGIDSNEALPGRNYVLRFNAPKSK